MESLSELMRLRVQIEDNGVRIAVVHMGTDEQAARLLSTYSLADVERFSDPERSLYEAFGLERTTLGKLFSPLTLLDVIRTGRRTGFPLGRLGRVIGDMLQMPGVFLLKDGRIVGDFKPERVTERPDYLELAALEC